MEKERKENKGFEMKIENWDNELANNIPSHADNVVISSDPKGNTFIFLQDLLKIKIRSSFPFIDGLLDH